VSHVVCKEIHSRSRSLPARSGNFDKQLDRIIPMARTHRTIPSLIIEIRPSTMLPGEIGLFAARPVKKDTVIAQAKLFKERFFPWRMFSKLDRITQAKIKQYCIQSKQGFYAPPDFNWLPAPWNMNHSCEYNIGLDRHGNFVTARSVKRGDELCWDYGMGISDPNFKLRCKCASRLCRKVITGNDWKNTEYMKSNRKYFARELLRAGKVSFKSGERIERRISGW